LSALKVISEPMSALARTSERDCRTRTTNENCTANESWTRTKYAYDGDGRRVAKVGSKLYWYGSGGDILAETNTSGTTTAEYIFFGGKRVAMLPAGSSAQFYVEDLLGTSRVMTTNTGVVCYDADFYPYGGERTPYTNTCTQNNYKFEGKERDTETGNDDFGARYYSNHFGRWLSADWSAVPVAVPYANLTNPQTLNLYSMVADDPESFADLDGHLGQQSQGGSIESGSIPTCASSGASGSGTIASGCGTSQPAQAQEKNQNDQVQQVIQAQADAKNKAIAEQTRTPSEQDKKNALVKAGKMGDAGVKAGLVVVAVEATVAVAVVGGPAALTTLKTGSQAAGAAAETYVPGGVATINQIPDVIRGWKAAGGVTTPATIPQTPGGMVGAGARVLYEVIKALW
jgi:RHS repeat-associated protein